MTKALRVVAKNCDEADDAANHEAEQQKKEQGGDGEVEHGPGGLDTGVGDREDR